MSPTDILKTASHLAALYNRVVALRAATTPAEVAIAEAAFFSSHTFLGSLRTAAQGLDDAARTVGEVLMMNGGIKLLHAVFAEVEAFGGDGSRTEWLDHRWNGLSDGRATWVA